MKPSKSVELATLAAVGLILWSCGSKEKEVAAPRAQRESESQRTRDPGCRVLNDT